MMKRILSSLAAVALLAMAAAPAPAADLALDGNLRGLCSTATASGGAATLANKCGTITSESLTTAFGSSYTLTLTNSVVAAADIITWSVDNGTNTGGDLVMGRATAAAGSIVFLVKNPIGGTVGSSSALNGTIKIKYMVIKP